MPDIERMTGQVAWRWLWRRVIWVVAVVLAGGACAAPRKPPDIILISLDTLRRDHVGVYQSGIPSFTPNLDDFAASAAVFKRAYAQIPFTLASHMSMFTGLYPDVHGVDRKRVRLAGHVQTLGQRLAEVGYESIGLVTNLWMKGEFGFDRGFAHYERITHGLTYADRVNARAFELLDSRDPGDRPLLLFLHYIDPHSDFFKGTENTLPYYAPRSYLDRHGVQAVDGEFCDSEGRCATDFLMAADREDRPLSPETIEQVAAQYGAGVEYMDHQLGLLFEGLKSRGLWQDAVIVITSDHGEEFREHGRFIHAQPYAETLAIPLLIKLPADRQAGTRVECIAETVDYLPTLLELAGAAIPEVVQGSSLLSAMAGDPECGDYALGRDKLNRSRFSLRTTEHALVHDLGTESTELYDLSEDPGERTEIGAEHPELADQLRARLLGLLEDNRQMVAALLATNEVETDILTEEERERLRAIGYVD